MTNEKLLSALLDAAENYKADVRAQYNDAICGASMAALEKARAAVLARMAGPGEVVVPKEPSREMLAAFNRVDKWLKSNEGTRYAVAAAAEGAQGEPYWKAMLAARPNNGGKDGIR